MHSKSENFPGEAKKKMEKNSKRTPAQNFAQNSMATSVLPIKFAIPFPTTFGERKKEEEERRTKARKHAILEACVCFFTNSKQKSEAHVKVKSAFRPGIWRRI